MVGWIKALFGLVGAERRIALASLVVVGAGLALVAGYYVKSEPPAEAKAGPRAAEAPYDATGSLSVGSLHDGQGDEAEAPVEKKRPEPAKPREEVAAAPRAAEADENAGGAPGVLGSGREVREEAPDSLEDLAGTDESAAAEEGAAEEGAVGAAGGEAPPPAEEPEAEPAAAPAAAPAAEEEPRVPRPSAAPAGPVGPPPTPEWTEPEDKTLYLTIPSMARVQGTPAYDAPGDDEGALAAGTIHLKGTGFPWQREANVYVAGHRLGYPGTGSDQIFYDMDVVAVGDEILVEDANGGSYTYRVFDTSIVGPDDLTVASPQPGKNVLTLQTCTLPDYADRLLVHAERVA